MNPNRTVHATFLTMIAVQTVASIDSKHKLPGPRQFAAVSVVWAILFFMVDTGWAQIAARLSMLIVLTSMVLGPFGKVTVGFLQTVAQKFQPAKTIRNKFGGTPAPAPPAKSVPGATGVTGSSGIIS